MKDKRLMEFNSFTGHLDANGSSFFLTFLVRINYAGEVEFDFGTIALNKETKFIMEFWYKEESKVKLYSLSGKSADGIEFKTDNLHFNSLNHSSNSETGSCMNPVGQCSSAEFYRKLSEPIDKPMIRMHIKGFLNFGQLSAKCEIGTVRMDGNSSFSEPNSLTGYIEVVSDIVPSDYSAWKAESDKLLEYVRRIMSFVSATVLHVPIIEYFSCNDLNVVALSQLSQALSSMRTVHFLNQQSFFNSAVKSYFNPPIKVENLFFAIEWFTMNSTYNEVRLINAMTVLENIVASNLSSEDSQIRPKNEFNKTRKVLRKVIKDCIKEWGAEEQEDAKEDLIELNERLIDLNRRSIFKKFKTLISRWSVPLDGISEEELRAAKRARDLIVHRGHYYEESQEDVVDLWHHVTVVREIIVRIFLTAIGYKGGYCSYLGGYHEAQFPPKVDTYIK